MVKKKWETKFWAKDSLKKSLTPMQYKITQKNGTERPFKNEYWDNQRQGIYVDVVSGEPLFSSTHKYKSGTGWPSFYKPLVKENLVFKEDKKLFSTRIEARSKHANSHLGHVFDDGPAPTGKRYCMNSAALKFIPKEQLKEKGYGEFEVLFKDDSSLEKITFAGGCFWCMEPPFEKLAGVKSVVSGYMGGHKKDPTYKEVSAGSTGHAEVVEVTFDPTVVKVEKLIEVFWQNIDPTQVNGQFNDIGSQYRTGIFYHNEDQKKKAESSKKKLIDSKKFDPPIVTEVAKASDFYKAEEYHQDYYKKNTLSYKFYRTNSGRDSFINKFWKK